MADPSLSYRSPGHWEWRRFAPDGQANEYYPIRKGRLDSRANDDEFPRKVDSLVPWLDALPKEETLGDSPVKLVARVVYRRLQEVLSLMS